MGSRLCPSGLTPRRVLLCADVTVQNSTEANERNKESAGEFVFQTSARRPTKRFGSASTENCQKLVFWLRFLCFLLLLLNRSCLAFGASDPNSTNAE